MGLLPRGRGRRLPDLQRRLLDGTGWGYPAADAFNRDTNGCDNGTISDTITRSFSKRVKRVQFVVREADGGVTKESDTSTWKDNRNT